MGGALGPMIGEGSIYEQLRRRPETPFDPLVGTGALVYDEAGGRDALADLHRGYLAVAADAGLPALALTDTWRASARRIAASRWAGEPVNGANVALLRAVIAERPGSPVLLGGLLGPDGDAYDAAAAPAREEARRLHAPQADALAAAGVDLLVTQTLPALGEALGLADAMAATFLPYVVSFVVRPDGTILDGTPLGDVVAALDDLDEPPAMLMANCVHPSILDAALRAAPTAVGRLVGLQANTAALSPEELDGAATLVGAEPTTFANELVAVARRHRLTLLGGCCGTDARHLAALARAMRA